MSQSILDRMTNARRDQLRHTGAMPSRIYLGVCEWVEWKKSAESMPHMFPSNGPDTFDGMRVFMVSEIHHLAACYVHGDR